MKYKITIRKCAEQDRAHRIANEIARWSGSSADVVFKVITEKPVCIKREAEEDEAYKIKEQFEKFGAEVELIPLSSTAAPALQSFTRVMPAVGAKTKVSNNSGEEEDDDDVPGRILDDREFTEIMKKRNDIFERDTGTLLRNIEIIFIVLGFAVGFWLSTMQLVNVATDFYEKLPEERTAKFVTNADLPKTLQEQKKEEKKKEEDIKTTDKKQLKPNKSKGANGTTGGGGDPRSRVTAKGVLGIISGQIKGKTVASADLFGKGGFATGIDAIISGVGGLKAGGGGGSGRRGVAGIGYGAGYGSGFGGSGSGGVDDLIGNLMEGGGGGLDLKKRGSLNISAPDFMHGAALTGGRSKASIMRVVMQNLAALRYAYNKRLREKPGLKGKITVKWAIDEFGKVIFCQVVESTMDDSEMETIVVDKIKRWVFDKIDKPGDVTEIIYPFVFSQ